LPFCDLLLGREAGATGQLGEEEVSALRETGNILSASFVGALADETDLDLRCGCRKPGWTCAGRSSIR